MGGRPGYLPEHLGRVPGEDGEGILRSIDPRVMVQKFRGTGPYLRPTRL